MLYNTKSWLILIKEMEDMFETATFRILSLPGSTDKRQRQICHKVLLRKFVPSIINMRKVDHQHHTFNTMEARAITCFNMGNLVFKDSNPHKDKLKGNHVED